VVTNPRITVLCVEDHAIVREGIAFIIDFQPDMKVVATAATGQDGVNFFRQHQPDITLMDLQLPDMDGTEAIAKICGEFPEARIIVLTAFQGVEDIHRALEVGAISYILKEALSEELISVVREVHAGLRPISPAIAMRLSERDAYRSLTPREEAVMELIALGKRNKEVANALGISEETAHAHIRRIFSKLNVHDRTAAVTVALHRGIIRLSQRDGSKSD
jgi:two-component system NarL family response regulator